MENRQIFKILLAGPESTGKTTLAQTLSYYYKTVWVSEFAREYMEEKLLSNRKNAPVKTDDLISIADALPIALGQAAKEVEAIHLARQFIFCDAGVLSTQVYAEHYFGEHPAELHSLIKHQNYDFCLLMSTDLAWEADWQRTEPHRREELLERFKNALQQYNIPYSLIEGEGECRIAAAIQTLNRWLENNTKRYQPEKI